MLGGERSSPLEGIVELPYKFAAQVGTRTGHGAFPDVDEPPKWCRPYVDRTYNKGWIENCEGPLPEPGRDRSRAGPDRRGADRLWNRGESHRGQRGDPAGRGGRLRGQSAELLVGVLEGPRRRLREGPPRRQGRGQRLLLVRGRRQGRGDGQGRQGPRHRPDRRLRRLRGRRQAVHGGRAALRHHRGRLPGAARGRGQGPAGPVRHAVRGQHPPALLQREAADGRRGHPEGRQGRLAAEELGRPGGRGEEAQGRGRGDPLRAAAGPRGGAGRIDDVDALRRWRLHRQRGGVRDRLPGERQDLRVPARQDGRPGADRADGTGEDGPPGRVRRLRAGRGRHAQRPPHADQAGGGEGREVRHGGHADRRRDRAPDDGRRRLGDGLQERPPQGVREVPGLPVRGEERDGLHQQVRPVSYTHL